MHETHGLQRDSDMIVSAIDEIKDIPRPDLLAADILPQAALIRRRARQIESKGIPVHGPHKPGAIKTGAVLTTGSVRCPLPAFRLRQQLTLHSRISALLWRLRGNL